MVKIKQIILIRNNKRKATKSGNYLFIKITVVIFVMIIILDYEHQNLIIRFDVYAINLQKCCTTKFKLSKMILRL